MNCPACKDTVLAMADRNGIEIDYCPKCRGIWLDRGELDKIIERSESNTSAAGASPQPHAQPHAQPQQQPQQQTQPQQPYQRPRKPDDSDFGMVYQDPQGRPVYQKKRKSLLREIFDFD